MRCAFFCVLVVLVISNTDSGVSRGDDKEKFKYREPEEIRKDIKGIREKLTSLETELSKAEAERPKELVAIDWDLIPARGDRKEDAIKGWRLVKDRYLLKNVSVTGTLTRNAKVVDPRLLVCTIESPVTRGEIKVNASLTVEFRDIEQGPVIAKLDKPGITIAGTLEVRNGYVVALIVNPRIIAVPPEKK